VLFMRLHLARKAKRRCSTNPHARTRSPRPPADLCYHCRESAISGALLWSPPRTGPQAQGLLDLSAAISPRIAIVEAIHPVFNPKLRNHYEKEIYSSRRWVSSQMGGSAARDSCPH